jgi:type III secretory pathway component EscR
MGLKQFHVVFICASIVLSFLVGAWGVQQYRLETSLSGLAIAVVFYASGIALVAYCVRFLRKVKELGI